MDVNGLTERVIGCAIVVHRKLGPGLLESIYEAAMAIELAKSGLVTERQKKSLFSMMVLKSESNGWIC